MFVVGLLIAASFVLVPSIVNATVESEPDERGIYIYSESLDSRTIFPGDRDVSFYIRIRNGDNDEATDDDPIRHCNVTIEEAVRNVDGELVTTPIDNWFIREDIANATLWEGSSYYTFSGFEFNVKPDAETTYYNLTVRMKYRTSDGQMATFTGYIHFDISPRATLEDIQDLYPGDKKKGITVHVDVYASMKDTTLKLTAPTDFSWYGTTTQTVSAFRSGSSSSDWYVPFTISVQEGLRPELEGYLGTYRLEYDNPNDIHIIEMGEVAFHVRALPMLSATMEMGDFVQGTTATTLTVNVRNVGNVELLEGKVWINQVSMAFVFTTADHYEGSSTVSYSKVDIGDLRMHEQATVEFPVVVDTFIPEGKHKILMDFSCTFLDPVTETYRNVYTWWTMGQEGYYPVVNIDSSNVYLPPDGTTLVGMYETLQVVDDIVEIRLQSNTLLDLGGQLIDNWMLVYVENYGNVDYSNVVITLDTNTDESPFLNPVDPDSPIAEEIVMADTLQADHTYTVAAHLSIKPGTEPGVYLVPVMLKGINSDTGSVFSTPMEARVTLRGIGPRLKITDVSPSEVRPGDDFTLEFTITNVGDDTAWNTVLSVPPKVSEKEGVPSGVEDAVSTPEPEALPIHLGTIRPGDARVIEIPMKCSDSTEGGQIFPFYFTINSTDSYGFHPRGDALNYGVAIKTESSIGDSPWMTVIIIIVIGLLVIFAIVVTRWRGGAPVAGKEPEPEEATTPPPQADHPTVELYGKAMQPPLAIAEVPQKDPTPPPPKKTKALSAKRIPKSDLGQAKGEPLASPGFLDGAYAEGMVSLNWKRPIGEDPSNIKGYRILRWSTGTDLQLVGEVMKGLDYLDKAIQPGITYTYAVQTFNDSGQSEPSNWIEIVTA